MKSKSEKFDPSIVSLDHAAMLPYWQKVDAILGGVETMRAAKEKFLPKHEAETPSDYDARVGLSPFTNIFGDIAGNLSDKPFQKDLSVSDLPEDQAGLIEDIDGEGSHLQAFAQKLFYGAVTHGIHGVFVDYTKTNQALKTVKQEKDAGARPFWVSLSAEDIICVETEKITGANEITHLRFWANTIEREGFQQTVVQRIYEYNRVPAEDGSKAYSKPEYTLWEKGQEGWDQKETGSLTINSIPLCLLVVGRRVAGLRLSPILQDAADLQIELFQRESSLRNAEENTAFPMLAGNGVSPPTDEKGNPLPVPVGPKRVLFAPPDGEGRSGAWEFIEITAASLAYLAKRIEEKSKELRELGRQPLTVGSGNLTRVTTSFAAEKGNSAVQAAAFLLKDCLENALALSLKWLGRPEAPKVELFTDFEINIHGTETLDAVMELSSRGDLSLETTLSELKRRGALSANLEIDEELGRLLDEIPGDEVPSDELDAVLPNQGETSMGVTPGQK